MSPKVVGRFHLRRGIYTVRAGKCVFGHGIEVTSPEETEEETARAAILVAALARSLCPVSVIFVGRFFCSSFSASPSSPVRPRNSPFPPARKDTDCPGCRTRLYEAPSPGGLAYAPDNPFAGRYRIEREGMSKAAKISSFLLIFVTILVFLN